VTESPAPNRWGALALALRRAGLPADSVTATTTAEFLEHVAQSYAAMGRAAVGIVAAAIAPFAGPPVGVAACAVVSACFIAWSAYYARHMRRTPGSRLWAADVVVLVGLALAEPLLVAPELTERLAGWVLPVASFAMVALQWHTRPLPGLLAALLVGAALVAGHATTPGFTVMQAVSGGGAWTVVEALLSRLLWQLVRRGGRIAETAMQAGFTREREAALAAARRADQRLHWSTVHDTAASTLLMVGLGQVRGDEPWLRAQVERDIAALDADGTGEHPERVDLRAAVVELVATAPVEVELVLPPPTAEGVPVPGLVAAAMEGAVGEALENVRRHAGTGRATVRLAASPERVVLTVSDTGAGFVPSAVPSTRYGVDMSIRERMARAGGRGAVTSAPGAGTVVELEWRRG
jgi:signal transduction histidine kinase